MYCINLPQGCSLRDPEHPETVFTYKGPTVRECLELEKTLTVKTKEGVDFRVSFLTERQDQFTDRWISIRVPINYPLPPGQKL